MEDGEHGPHGLHVETIVRRQDLEGVIILPQSMEVRIVLETKQLSLLCSALEETVATRAKVKYFIVTTAEAKYLLNS